MWKSFVLLLAWPALGVAEEPVAKIKGDRAVTVVKGQVFTLDAGESKSEEDLQWTASPEVGFILGSPANGRLNRSILIVNGELTAHKYRFTVKARGKAADGVMTTKEDSVEATVAVGHVTPESPVVVTSVKTPIAQIEGPDHITPGTDLILDGRGSRSDPVQSLIWAVNDKRLDFELITPEGGLAGAMLSAKKVPPGDYVFTLVARGTPDKETGKSPLPAVMNHFVSVSATPRSVPDHADLQDLSTPPCLSGPVYVWLVADSARFDQRIKAHELATRIRPSGTLFGFTLLAYDSAALLQMQPGFRPYLNGFRDVTGKQWPRLDGMMLIIQDKDGRVISTAKAPQDDATLLRKIRDLRL